MARVNVEKIALSDSRFDVLAKIAGLADRDHALGKMVRIWNECQERESYNLPETMLDAIIGKTGSGDLLVTSSLAKRTRRGFFYIRGTRGRIEWLRERRKDGRTGGKKGGRPKKPVGDTSTKPLGVDGNTTAGNPSGSGSGSGSGSEQEPEKKPESRSNRASPVAAKRDGFGDYAFQTWEASEGSRPPWGKTEYIALAEARKRLEAEDRARATWDRYLTDADPFFAGHPPGKFLSQLSRFAGKSPLRKLTLAERNEAATSGWGES